MWWEASQDSWTFYPCFHIFLLFNSTSSSTAFQNFGQFVSGDAARRSPWHQRMEQTSRWLYLVFSFLWLRDQTEIMFILSCEPCAPVTATQHKLLFFRVTTPTFRGNTAESNKLCYDLWCYENSSPRMPVLNNSPRRSIKSPLLRTNRQTYVGLSYFIKCYLQQFHITGADKVSSCSGDSPPVSIWTTAATEWAASLSWSQLSV